MYKIRKIVILLLNLSSAFRWLWAVPLIFNLHNFCTFVVNHNPDNDIKPDIDRLI